MADDGLKYRVLAMLARHVGKHNVIGMGELYESVFGESWSNRINDTRALRQVITELRKDGTPIVSSSSTSGGGYYLASAGSELEEYCRKLRAKALRALTMEARLRNKTLGELMGQLHMSCDQPAKG